ncbi:hypothetical protein H4R26_001892 [Coemansia thaxteri]|uniref:Small ribosomal subunit protein uS7 domain-containing protein n=1 Tax=Coemansia thaxteri TaxID=2663907 RepID=A0A9W8BFL6_9FUNG|nr:hypothetical protein H4R26_001892 [Coemansia thaxteri]KAJ2467390.1 hypothetical protein EV174_006410 [Coemansia sp. RSA 2320]
MQTKVMETILSNSPMEINHRIGVPEPLISAQDRLRLRNDPLLSQLVNMIMRDGKKMRAERFVQTALLDIRTHTNSDPYKLLADAIDMVAPLMDTRSSRMGSKVIQVPRALNLRQRRRKAIVWILETAGRRNEREFHMRLSGELQAIVNGTSSILEKKLLLHKSVLLNRSHIRTTKRF